jgi:hypothetical protein
MADVTLVSTVIISSIHEELDSWQRNGELARFWWRDDDAQIDNKPFKRLIQLAEVTSAPLILAVSPGIISESFVEKLNGIRNVHMAAHGFRHVNYNKGALTAEFGNDRPLEVMIAEIEHLAKKFASMFPNRGLSMFVPPWHGLDQRLIPYLSRSGFKCLSMHESFSVRAAQIFFAKIPSIKMAFARPGSKSLKAQSMDRANIAINFLSSGARHLLKVNPLHQALGALRLRRLGLIAIDRPIGLMTHHLQHDESAWEQLSQLIAVIVNHPASYFIQSEDLCPLFRKTVI